MDYICRKTIQVNLVRIPPKLKELASRTPKNSTFTERHGSLLNLVTSNADEDMMKVLFQFLIPYTIASHFPIINLCQLWRNSHKIDLNSFPAKGFHNLQNRNKDEDPKSLKWLVDAYDAS